MKETFEWLWMMPAGWFVLGALIILLVLGIPIARNMYKANQDFKRKAAEFKKHRAEVRARLKV
jgi:hypothetical protein